MTIHTTACFWIEEQHINHSGNQHIIIMAIEKNSAEVNSALGFYPSCIKRIDCYNIINWHESLVIGCQLEKIK